MTELGKSCLTAFSNLNGKLFLIPLLVSVISIFEANWNRYHRNGPRFHVRNHGLANLEKR
jgi:hypothetical protein